MLFVMRRLKRACLSLYITSMVVMLFRDVYAQESNNLSSTASHLVTTIKHSPIEQNLHTTVLTNLKGTRIETIFQQYEPPLSPHPRAKPSEQIHAHKRDPSQTETFLGQVTLNSPAELPPQFVSRDISPAFRQSSEYLLRNTADEMYRKSYDESQIKVTSTIQRTDTLDVEEIARTSKKGVFTPIYFNFKPTKYTIMPKDKLLELEPLLEEPMNKKDYSEHNKQDVQVIKSITRASTDFSVDAGITKVYKMILTTKKEPIGLASTANSYTTTSAMEKPTTMARDRKQHTTQGRTTLEEILPTPSSGNTPKSVDETATTGTPDMKKTTSTPFRIVTNFEDTEKPDATTPKSSLIEYGKSASNRMSEGDIAVSPDGAVNNQTLPRYNQSLRSISELGNGEVASVEETARHTTMVSQIEFSINVTATELSATAATVEQTTLSRIKTNKMMPAVEATDSNNGNLQAANPLSPAQKITIGTSKASSKNNSDNSRKLTHQIDEQAPNLNKTSFTSKENAKMLDKAEKEILKKKSTQSQRILYHPYSAPILRTSNNTNDINSNDSLIRTSTNITWSTRLEDPTTTKTITTPKYIDQSKPSSTKHNQSREEISSFKKISTDNEDIAYHHKPLALAKSWSTKTNSEVKSISLLDYRTTDYPIAVSPSKATTSISKLINFDVCTGECDLAGIIKLTDGVTWSPQLSHKKTIEWQILADEVRTQLERIYNKSDVLKKWYKKIRVDGFSEGSVLVDYIVELNDIGRQINTFEIRNMFHESLDEVAKSLGGKKLVKFKMNLGHFTIDPIYTDFIVLPHLSPTIEYAKENLLPQWAIAVIVIGLASLLFVVIFGVTVIANRRKTSRKKLPLPFAEDIFAEVNKKHMLGIENYTADSIYNME